MARRGMGAGKGKGYRNIIGSDSRVHKMSACGIKQPQKIPANVLKFINQNPDKIREHLNQKGIKSIQTFKFEDLSPEAKEKALDKLRDINQDYEWWDGDLWLELSEKEMKESNIKLLSKDWFNKPLDENEIPQGEEYPAYTGLFKWESMEFDLDRGNYLQFKGLEIKSDDVFKKFLGIPKNLRDKIDYWFVNYGENDTVIEIGSKHNKEFTHKEELIIDKAILKFSEKINEVKSDLKKESDYRYSDEAIIQTIEANDYDFNSDGGLE